MYTGITAVKNQKITALIVFALLLGIAIVAPLSGNQFITGTIVNASLFIAVALLGIKSGLLVGMIPSTVALATGLLPPVLAPMIPFIITGNAVLVMTFGYLKNRNLWAAVIAGSVLKFILLWGTSSTVINLLMNQQVSDKVAWMMSWPQLVTALLGGIVACGLLFILRKVKK